MTKEEVQWLLERDKSYLVDLIDIKDSAIDLLEEEILDHDQAWEALIAEHQLALDSIQTLITWYRSRMANEFFDPKEGGDAVWGPIIEAYGEDD